jgi:hypothetical protein
MDPSGRRLLRNLTSNRLVRDLHVIAANTSASARRRFCGHSTSHVEASCASRSLAESGQFHCGLRSTARAIASTSAAATWPPVAALRAAAVVARRLRGGRLRERGAHRGRHRPAALLADKQPAKEEGIVTLIDLREGHRREEARPLVSIDEGVVRHDVEEVRRSHREQTLVRESATERCLRLGDRGLEQSSVAQPRATPNALELPLVQLKHLLHRETRGLVRRSGPQ